MKRWYGPVAAAAALFIVGVAICCVPVGEQPTLRRDQRRSSEGLPGRDGLDTTVEVRLRESHPGTAVTSVPHEVEVRVRGVGGHVLSDVELHVAAPRSGAILIASAEWRGSVSELLWERVGSDTVRLLPSQSAVLVRADHPQYASGFVLVDRFSKGGVDVSLDPAVVVSGAVRSASGELASQATVELRTVPVSTRVAGGVSRVTPHASMRSVDGRYEFQGIVPGALIEVRARTSQGVGVRQFVAGVGELDRDVTLERGGSVNFRLHPSLVESGLRVRDARVAHGSLHTSARYLGGVVTFETLPAGSYWFVIELSDGTSLYERVAISSGESCEVVLDRSALGGVSGRLSVDAEWLANHPLLLRIDPNSSGELLFHASGLSLGPQRAPNFDVQGLTRGAYQFSVGLQCGQLSRRSIRWTRLLGFSVPAAEIVLPVPEPWSMIVPNWGARSDVRIWDVGSDGEVHWSQPRVYWNQLGETSSRIAEFSPAAVWVCITSDGVLRHSHLIAAGTSGHIDLMQSEASTPTVPLVIHAEPDGGTLSRLRTRARVIEEMRLTAGSGQYVSPTVAGSEANAGGTIVLDDPPACEFHVLVEAAGFGSVVARVPDIRSDRRNLRLTLPRLAPLQVEVRDRLGLPCGSAKVTIQPRGQDARGLPVVSRTNAAGMLVALVGCGVVDVQVEAGRLSPARETVSLSVARQMMNRVVVELPLE